MLVIQAVWTSERANDRRSSSRNRIATSAHGADHVLEPAVLELPAQPVHVHIDHVSARVELVSPDLAQQRAPRDRSAALAQQRSEQRKLGWREIEALAAHAGGAPDQVER